MGSVASGATVSDGSHEGAKSLDVAPDAARAPAAGALGIADRRCAAVRRRSVDELLHLPRLDAAGAGLDALRRTVDNGSDTLDVGVPPALGPPVRVADTHAPRRVLAAHLANGCHVTRHLCVESSLRTEQPYWRAPGATTSRHGRTGAGRGGASPSIQAVTTLAHLGAAEIRAVVETYKEAL